MNLRVGIYVGTQTMILFLFILNQGVNFNVRVRPSHHKYFQEHPINSNYPLKINACSVFYVLRRPRLSVEIRMSLGAS